jgi:hypothetical protein
MQNTTAPVSGLTNVVNTVISPKEAFESLREAPTWGWALIITIVVGVVTSYLISPTLLHAFDLSWPAQVAASPRMAAMSDAEAAQAKHISEMFIGASPIFVLIFVPIFVLLEAVIMLIFNAIGKGSATFKSLWAVSANIAVPAAAIASIVNVIIVMARGVDGFPTMDSVRAAVPSLALLAPHAGKLTNFLGAFGVFSLWGAGLIVCAMLVTCKTNKAIAWIAGIVSIVIPALFTLLGPGAT